MLQLVYQGDTNVPVEVEGMTPDWAAGQVAGADPPLRNLSWQPQVAARGDVRNRKAMRAISVSRFTAICWESIGSART